MKALTQLVAALAVLSICVPSVLAKKVNKASELNIRSETAVTDETAWRELGRNIPRVAAQGTTFLAYFTFDAGANCSAEGWVSVDLLAQTHDFWHVDDFAGLGGGTFGGLAPLQGLQSMWCGARPNTGDQILCNYSTLPGYGTMWDQALCTENCLSVTTAVVLNVTVRWDSEPGYDATTLQIDQCDDNWADLYGGLGVWDGTGSDTLAIAVADSLHSGSLRFRFHFVSDEGFDDKDGIWDTDGAFILDELGVSDAAGVVVPFEDFEDESVGDNDADDWITCTPPGYGDYAALYPGLNLVQEDPCASDLSCVWSFYTGSTTDYGCGGWPTQTTVPYENALGKYIHNEIWSPTFPVIGSGSVWELRFDQYRDLPLSPLIFYLWHVRGVVNGCPTDWDDYGFVYYGGGKDWLRSTYGIGQFVPVGATEVGIAIGAIDLCKWWCGVYGDGQCHTHAPLIDNVELYRVSAHGPQWGASRDLDLFQDNFSTDGTITGTARADAALDILPGPSNWILPGDSAVVTVSDPEGGVDFHVSGDSSSGPAVYCFVGIDGPHGGTTGAPLVDDPRYPVVGTSSIAGRTWTQIQMDSARSFGSGGIPKEDIYSVDLNDNFFVPGDTVWFFFGARGAPPTGAWTYWAIPVTTPTNQTSDIDEAAANPDEFTILPAVGRDVADGGRGGEILYVDGMNFRGAQPYFDTAFQMMGIDHQVDRYDIRGPSSAVGNHPGSRVQNVFQQLIPIYRTIVWNTGNLTTAFGDGSGSPDMSDDTGMLFTFLESHTASSSGVYLNGDQIAYVWLNDLTSASALSLRSAFMTYGVANEDHAPLVGVSPLGVGAATGTIFKDLFGPDTLVAYGGCPLINTFDILEPMGTAALEMSYHGGGNTAGAVVSQATVNSLGNDVAFVLSGFSYHYIRDAFARRIPARAEHLHRILIWLNHIVDSPVEAGTPGVAVNELRQNYPNPFNPTTMIEYQIKETGHVTLRIYNVAGQLVRTLVDEHAVKAGSVQQIRWRGLNDAGQRVSNGVYFCRLVAKDYTQTKKMVLLK